MTMSGTGGAEQGQGTRPGAHHTIKQPPHGPATARYCTVPYFPAVLRIKNGVKRYYYNPADIYI